MANTPKIPVDLSGLLDLSALIDTTTDCLRLLQRNARRDPTTNGAHLADELMVMVLRRDLSDRDAKTVPAVDDHLWNPEMVSTETLLGKFEHATLNGSMLEIVRLAGLLYLRDVIELQLPVAAREGYEPTELSPLL